MCKLWFSIITLAQDDEMGIRETLFIGLFGDAIAAAMCDRKALQVIMKTFCSQMLHCEENKGNRMSALVLLIGWILREDFELKSEEADDVPDDIEDRLFDKSEMNYFSEPLLLLRTLMEHCSRSEKKYLDLVKTPLSAEQLGIFNLASNLNVVEKNCTIQSILQKFDDEGSNNSNISEYLIPSRSFFQNFLRKELLLALT